MKYMKLMLAILLTLILTSCSKKEYPGYLEYPYELSKPLEDIVKNDDLWECDNSYCGTNFNGQLSVSFVIGSEYTSLRLGSNGESAVRLYFYDYNINTFRISFEHILDLPHSCEIMDESIDCGIYSEYLNDDYEKVFFDFREYFQELVFEYIIDEGN